jgi:magnesium-transporting ATPase (P-type)
MQNNKVPDPEQSSESKWVVRGAFVFLAIILGAIGYGLYQKGGNFLYQLQETAVSRGLITFLVALVTVSIALVIAVWVVASEVEDEKLKQRFAYAKDILATLVGILGTILGFYFGSTEQKSSESLSLAELQFRSGQLIVSASGGTPPFRFTIKGLSDDGATIARVSDNGWLFEPLPSTFKSGASVIVEVIDARGRKAFRTGK